MSALSSTIEGMHSIGSSKRAVCTTAVSEKMTFHFEDNILYTFLSICSLGQNSRSLAFSGWMILTFLLCAYVLVHLLPNTLVVLFV